MPSLSVISLWRLSSAVRSSRTDADTVQVHSLLNPNECYTYSRRRLHIHRQFIASMLARLPRTMHQSSSCLGERWFKATYNSAGTTWCNLAEADRLLSIGRAAHMVSLSPPVGDDAVCDTPYALILDNDIRTREKSLPPNERITSICRWRF